MPKDNLIRNKILESIEETRKMAHPVSIGMTEEDIKIIHAYHTALRNLIQILRDKKIL